MNLFNAIKRFVASDEGAITVDWVVITAVSTGFAVAVLAVLLSSSETLSSRIDSHLSRQTVSSTYTP